MVVRDRPKVVDEDVEDREEKHEEHGRVASSEANSDHDASYQSQQGCNDADKRPFTVESGANEQEDEQDSTCQLQVGSAVAFRQLRKGGKHTSLLGHWVGEHHDKTTDDRQVTQEKGEIKDQSVSESLSHYNGQKTIHGVFLVSTRNHTYGACKHDLKSKIANQTTTTLITRITNYGITTLTTTFVAKNKWLIPLGKWR